MPDLIQLNPRPTPAAAEALPRGGEGEWPPGPAPGAGDLGLYVHIPFCVRKCHYCDFNTGAATEPVREAYVAGLCEEIRSSPWAGREAATVFFGGGTPSELAVEQLARIVAALRETFPGPDGATERRSDGATERGREGERRPGWPRPQEDSSATVRERPAPDGRNDVWEHMRARRPRSQGTERAGRPRSQEATGNQEPETRNPAAEWTLECNPGTADREKLAAFRQLGFNRISLGVQSFHDHHLEALGRIHSAAEAAEAVRWAREVGFAERNLDLIFALPGQTLAEWQADVRRALELAPEHFSFYQLIIEEQTEFGRRHRLGLLPAVDDDLGAEMYEFALDALAEAGYEQYEISNWARPGRRCRHNLRYWRNEEFLGFGLSAASYAGGARWSNVARQADYLARLRAGRPAADFATLERLPALEAAGEAIMLGLRLTEGVDLAEIERRHGVPPTMYAERVRRFQENGLLERRGNSLRLTRRGTLLANVVCAEFLS